MSEKHHSASEKISNTDQFYGHYFVRDCANLPNCSEITEETIFQGGEIKIVQHNYVVPESDRGANPT